jgi:hypothetical protein
MAGIALTAAALLGAAPAQADVDTDFTNELHTYGIYGQKDYNAWIAKITCKRLNRGLDTNAAQSAKFIHDQLVLDSTTEQAYQFLGGALRMYCPDELPILAPPAQ